MALFFSEVNNDEKNASSADLGKQKTSVMSKRWKIINGAVFCVWIALLALLLYKNYTGAPLEKPGALADAFGKETYWYDIYRGNKKIGYASTNIEKAGNEIIIRHEREMKVQKERERFRSF